MNILIYRNDGLFGPYTVSQCLAYLSESRLSNQDLAWREGLPEWQPLHAVLRAALEETPVVLRADSLLAEAIAPSERSHSRKTMRIILPDDWEPIGASQS